MIRKRQGFMLALLVVRAADADVPQTDIAVEPGRVFTTAEERSALDRLRRMRSTEASAPAVPPEAAATSPSPPDPAVGLILRSNGEAYVWVDDAFRKADEDELAREAAPRDDLKIIRHRAPRADEAVAGTDADAEPGNGETN